MHIRLVLIIVCIRQLLLSAFQINGCHHTSVNIFASRNIFTHLLATNVNTKKKKESTTIKSDRDTRGIIQYNEELANNRWNVSQLQYNSSTMRYIFGFKDEVTSFFVKIEQAFITFAMRLSSKVERDLSTTSRASEYVVRKTVKGSTKLVAGLTDLSRPIMELPSAISRLTSTNTSAMTLMRLGVNPLEESTLISNFDSTTTKQKAKKKKSEKKQSTPLAVDSVYRAVRTLPSRLQYDYSRRLVAREASISPPQESAYALPELPTDTSIVRVSMRALVLLSLELRWLRGALADRLREDEEELRELSQYNDDETSASAISSTSETARELFIRVSTLRRIISSLDDSISASARICGDDNASTTDELILSASSISDCLLLTSCRGYVAQLLADIETNERIRTIASILAVLDNSFTSFATSSAQFQEQVKQESIGVLSTSAESIATTSMITTSVTDTTTENVLAISTSEQESSNVMPIVTVDAISINDEESIKGKYFSQKPNGKTFQQFLRETQGADAYDEKVLKGDVSKDVLYVAEDRELVLETTAVIEDQTKDEKAVKLFLTSVDVVLFLVETVIKTTVPILKGGGSRVIGRLSQTWIGAWTVVTPARKWILARIKSSKKETVPEETHWELLDSLRNSKRKIL